VERGEKIMTKRKNVLQKFGSFFDRLNEKEQCQLLNLMSAVRGPDIPDEYDRVKWNTTAVIRSRLLKYTNVKIEKLCDNGYFLQDPLPGMLINSEGTIDLSVLPEHGHFRGHINRAYEALFALGEL
jgi:hypothetical protein